MAFSNTYFLNRTGMPPGRNQYRYDTTDHPDVVEAANYFNNVTNDLILAKGDEIKCVTWSATPFAAASTISLTKTFIVTNVIDRAAAANAGAVNIAEDGISSAGALSSLL